MELKYHQATYDLLSKNFVELKRLYDELAREMIALYNPPLPPEEQEKQLKQKLAWAKIDLSQHLPQVSEQNVQQLDALEQKYNVKIPASVREWFSLDIAPKIMSIKGFGCVPIKKFMPFSEMEETEDLKVPREDYWYFIWDEYIDQGGEPVAFKINAGDDPPVFAENVEEVVELAPTFSSFLYGYFWDWMSWLKFPHAFSFHHVPAVPRLQIPEQYHVPLKLIRESFNELSSCWLFRFYDEHTRISVQKYIHMADGKRYPHNDMLVGGYFLADTLDNLKMLITRIWGSNAPVFQMDKTYHNSSFEETGQFIDDLRRDKIRYVLQQANDWVMAPDLALLLGKATPDLLLYMVNYLDELITNGEIEAEPEGAPRQDQRYRWKK